MIRLILRDLFPTRAQVGALRAKTHEVTGHLVAVNAKCADQAATIEHLRNHIESLSAELAEVEAERDALAKRALRPTPTPGEARMLEIVRANPGLLTAQLCDLARPGTIAVELEKYRREYGEPPANSWLLTGAQTRSEDEAQYLTGLHKKSLVRRERSGNTYRYWVTT